MDSHSQDQQQKDFLSTFFSNNNEPNHHPDPTQQQHQQHHPQQHGLFNGSALTLPNMLAHPMHAANGAPTEMDLIGSFMAMQGIDTQSALSPSAQSSYNPQMLLEQQFKLNQLQQLQQLQNQIFQQQVRWGISGSQGQWPERFC